MKLFKLLIIFFCIPICFFAQVPATEVRAVWITTNWGLDWPTNRGASVENQKKELIKILDDLKALNINTILFQARAQGRVFYKSDIEARSSFFNHKDNFDPLAFAIEECHKRGMECHAWLITFPMEMAKVKYTGKGKNRKATVLEKKPDHYKLVDNRWYLDPGRPETRRHLVSLVREIVSGYDVDGVHFDYIRYPSNTQKFPDEDTFKKYGNGKSLHDWRRDNINRLVTEIYDNVKDIKKWVQVSSSPLGRYKSLPHINANDGWTGYETVYQDAGYWMKNDKHDLVFPMMYHSGKYFYPFLDDWVTHSNGRTIVPGLGIYQMDEQSWPLDEILSQMKYIREKGVRGEAYFRAGNILSNLKGIKDSIKAYYPAPAKLPPLTWLDNEAPNSPVNLRLEKDIRGNLNISWEAPDNNEDFTYNVYVSSTEDFSKDNPNFMLATGIRDTHYSFSVSTGEFAFYYFVTASDRYHNESVVCFPGYFVHSEKEY